MKFEHSPPASLLSLLAYVAQFALGPVADRLSHVEKREYCAAAESEIYRPFAIQCSKGISLSTAGTLDTEIAGGEITLGRFSFLVADLCKYPVPPRSCPRDLATTDPTGGIRLSTYGTRGKHGCIIHVRQARDL